MTTDLLGANGYVGTDFSLKFGGTSMAAMVSGVVALMLEANPFLGWRDVQLILLSTAKRNDPDKERAHWVRNAVGGITARCMGTALWMLRPRCWRL